MQQNDRTLADGAGLPVLLDAEQSHRQPAIDHIALELQARNQRDDTQVDQTGLYHLFSAAQSMSRGTKEMTCR